MTLTPTAGAFEGREHCLPVRVYYEDTDFTGLVYHGTYVRYFERGRSDFLRLAGIDHVQLLERDEPLAFVVVRMQIEFKRAARIDDALIVRTRFEQLKGPRLIIAQAIERQGEPICTASVEVAFIDLKGRVRRPPQTLVEILQPWLNLFGDDASLP